jgi:tetratricopeptide (TPR) repeat protein/DNA-binding SARP family transcriptional activator
MGILSLRTLGSPEVRLDGTVIELGLKPTVLLTLLALTPTEQAHTRDQIAAWLWPDKPNPLGNLSTALNKLRELISPSLFVSDERRRTLFFAPEQTVECDANHIASIEKTIIQHDRWAAWGHLLDFPDPYWDMRFGEGFQDWLAAERQRLNTVHQEQTVRLARQCLERHDWLRALPYLKACPPETGDPREIQTHWAMLVLTAFGHTEQALQVHQHLETVLAELELKPGADIRAAWEIAASRDVSTAVAVLEALFPIAAVTEMPFVGRHETLNRLATGVPLDLEGRAWVIIVTGEPGAGKTALTGQFVRSVTAQRPFLRAKARCEPLSPAWKTMEVVTRGVINQNRAKPREVLARDLFAALARLVPDLLEPPDFEQPSHDGHLLFMAARTLLSDEARPTLLWLDDLQWIDPASLGLLLELIRKPPPRGILVVATRRTQATPEQPSESEREVLTGLDRLSEILIRNHCGHEMALEPLTVVDVHEWSGLLQVDAINAPWMQAQSGGNPLYLEQMFQNAYTTPDATLPSSLEDQVRARIRGLNVGSAARTVLESCAVLGNDLNQYELRPVTDLSYEEVNKATETLRATGLMQRHNLNLNHAITRDVTLSELAPERLQLFHLRAAQVRRDQPEHAAEHYWQAMNQGEMRLEPDELQAVIDVFTQTGSLQSLRGDFEHGLQWFERSLRQAQQPADRIQTLIRRARVHERLMRYDEAERDLEQAKLIAPEADALTRVALHNEHARLVATCFHDAQQATRIAKVALQLLEDLTGSGVSAQRANALNVLGIAAWLENRLDDAEAHHREALAIRRELEKLDSITESLLNFALVLSFRNDVAAEPLFREAEVIFENTGNTAQLWRTYSNLGEHFRRQGDFTQAEQHLNLALSIGRRIGDDANLLGVLNNLGAVYFHQARWHESREAYLEALASKRLVRNAPGQALILGNLAEVGLRLGLLDEVEDHIARAKDLLAQVPNTGREAGLWLRRGDLNLLKANKEQAQKAYETGLKLANESGRDDHRIACQKRLEAMGIEIAKVSTPKPSESEVLEPYEQAIIGLALLAQTGLDVDFFGHVTRVLTNLRQNE